MAATYYVATNGSDAASGAIETPWRTVVKAIGVMVAGDTTYVRGGTYNENEMRFRRSGTALLPIKLLNYPGESPKIICNASTPVTGPFNRIILLHGSGQATPIEWISIEGFEITACYDGMKMHSANDITIRNNWIHDNEPGQGILGYGTRILIEKNRINHNGNFLTCTPANGSSNSCNQDHGIYMNGSFITIRQNLIYDSLAYGIQINGNTTFTTACASSAHCVTSDWFIYNNTIAYANYSGAIVVWSSVRTSKIHNNIFYENGSTQANSTPNGITFQSPNANTFVTINGNLSYASGSGGTVFIVSGTLNTHYTLSGNIVGNPLFVNGGSNALPVSPDFTLTSTSPAINAGVPVAGEVPNGSNLDIGAFEANSNPECPSITGNVITCIIPMGRNVPVQNLSTLGVIPVCFGSACPSNPTATAVSRVVGTDTHIEIIVGGIAGNACVAANQTWELDYNSSAGAWTDNANIGPYPGIHQKMFSFTAVPVVNQCTGTPVAGYPAGYHIYYKFNENTGTNANDESANNLDCTFTNSPTWGPGKTLSAMVVAAGSTQHCAIPWGSGVNPYSTDLTIVAPVLIAVGTESGSHYVFGPSHGTNQRFYVCSHQGTWRISYQAVPCQSTAASSLAVTSGWNHLVVRTDGTTHVATIYKDGVAGTGGASVTLTSFTLASNLTLGRVASLASSGGTYDDFLVYLSLQDPVTLYNAFQGISTPLTGMIAQAAVQAQGPVLDLTTVWNAAGLNASVEVVQDGGVAIVFQVHCQNTNDCDPTAFKLVYTKNQTAAVAASAGTLLQVPGSPTADGIWMWGINGETGLNSGATTTRLTGSCAVTDGSTQLAVYQIPNIDLPQDGCVMLRYLVRVGQVSGSFFELRLLTEGGLPLDGGYAADARIEVVNPRGSAGF